MTSSEPPTVFVFVGVVGALSLMFLLFVMVLQKIASFASFAVPCYFGSDLFIRPLWMEPNEIVAVAVIGFPWWKI